MQGASGTRLANVADAVDPMDAVNRRQLDAASDSALAAAVSHADQAAVQTLGAAEAYTDLRAAQTLQAAWDYADAGDARTLSAAMAYTDQRFSLMEGRLDALQNRMDEQFRLVDQRMDRLGAMSSAQINMAMNAAGAAPGRGRVAVGMGWQNGEEALSVGYGRRFTNGVSMSVGGSFGRGGERSGGVGVGFNLF